MTSLSLQFSIRVSIMVLCSASGLAQKAPPLADASFEPLRGPAAVPFLPEYAIWGIAIATAAILLFVLWVIRGSKRSAKAHSGKINPLNIALESISELEGKLGDLQAGDYSSAVSEIVRRYIEQACEIPAQEQTTEEFLQSIQNNPYFTEEIREPLAHFLGLCDMAKFAQQSVDLEQRKTLLKEAGQLVEKLYRFVVKRSKEADTSPPPLKAKLA